MQMIDASVFDRAANIVKHMKYSCHAINKICNIWIGDTRAKEIKIFIKMHGYKPSLITDAAESIGIDKITFREQLLRELAYSLRMQGFSKDKK